MNDSTNALDRPRKKAEHIGLQAKSSTNADDTLDLGAIWDTIKRHKWIIFSTCVLVTALVIGITLMLPRIYQSTAVVAIEDKAGGSSKAMPMMAGWGGRPELSTEIGVLKNSGELGRRVISKIKSVADTTEEETFTLLAPGKKGQTLSEYELNLRLQEMVTFTADPERGLIEIIVRSESPEESALIANVYAQEYQQFSREMARSGVTAARKFLESQLEKRKEDIREIEQEWERFAQNNAVVTDGLDGQNVAREYADLQTRRDALVFQLEQEKQTLSVLKDQLEQVQPSLRSKVLNEQRVQSLRTQIQSLEDQIAELKTEAEQFYINDPSLRGNESRVPELADIRRRIEGFEKRKVELTEELVEATRSTEDVSVPTAGDGSGSSSIGELGTLRNRIREQEMTISQLEAQIKALNGRIQSYESRIDSLPRQTIQREQLDRRLAQAEQFYKDIAMELQRTIVTEESELGYVKIMRSAVVPLFPVSPNTEQNVILGLLLGLGLGTGLAFLRQSTNWQIYEPDDIQTKGYSLVGVIPRMDREIKKAFKGKERIEVEGKSLSTRLFPLLNPWSPITENYRLIRANLQFAAAKNGQQRNQPTQLMMITSPEPGDGKTTTAVNLAITVALSGRSVLLIDADMRRANLHKMLGVEREPGLADILTGSRTADVIQSTVVNGLSFLSAGVPSVPPTELLDTERMRQLLETGTERFDVIILDTPPVLATTDPVVIAPNCDAVLVVASADKTDFRALSQTESTLEAVGVPIGGIIFNRYDAEKASIGYKYGYGYDYKYDYSPTSS